MKQKNIGIELTRIISMYMVMILHIMLQGGVLEGSQGNLINNQLAWLLESICICAVNLFGLISGFVLVNSAPKISRIVSLWVQVMMYSAIFGILGYLFLGNSLRSLVSSFLPLSTRQYWYFSAYFILYLCIPILNPWLRGLDMAHSLRVLVYSILILSVYGGLLQRSMLFLEHGYSPLWLGVLYIVGAHFRRFGFPKIKSSTIGLVIGLSVTCNLLFINLSFMGYQSFQSAMFNFTSPVNLATAVGIFIISVRHEYKNNHFKNICQFLGSLVFSAYLLQTSPTIFRLISKRFILVGSLNTMLMLILIAALAFAFLVTAISFEIVRRKLMMLIHEQRICDWIDKKTREGVNWLALLIDRN